VVAAAYNLVRLAPPPDQELLRVAETLAIRHPGRVVRGDASAASVLPATLAPAAPHGLQALPESARRALRGPGLNTVIGTGARLEGRLTAAEPVRIHGSVQGELISSETIVVEKSGEVTATVSGAQVVVAGQIDGVVRATGRVELRPTARMQGELHTGILVIQEGAAFEGRVSMTDSAPASRVRSEKPGPGNPTVIMAAAARSSQVLPRSSQKN
jgi:cytoskeletal protein CcmA (bactofilin family)